MPRRSSPRSCRRRGRTRQSAENSGVAVRQPRGMSEDDQEPRLVAVLAAVAAVLLIVCCANLAGLLSAQTAAREGEFAIRVSLGAGDVPDHPAGADGIPAAVARRRRRRSRAVARLHRRARSMLFSMDDEGHPLYYDFSQSSAIILATMVAAVVAGVLFSVVPAIRAVRRPSVRPASLRSTSVRWSTGRWLLGAQAAIAVAMIATAALLASSARVVLAGRNYDTSHVALMRVRPRLVKYTPERAQRFQRQVIQQLRGLSSVESVDDGRDRIDPGWRFGERRLSRDGPTASTWRSGTTRSGRRISRPCERRSSWVASSTIAIRHSRHQLPSSTKHWPDGCGLRVDGSARRSSSTTPRARSSVSSPTCRSRAGTNPPNPGPLRHTGRIPVRSIRESRFARPAILRLFCRSSAREVHRVDPGVPIAETITLPVRMAGLTRPVRVAALFVGYAASLAMLLTAIGLYGALAFAVSRRTREIGIRVALGAARARLVGSIVREGLTVVLPGAAVGVLLAIATSRVCLASPVRIGGSGLGVLRRGRIRCHCRRPWGVTAAGAPSRRRRSHRRAPAGVIGCLTDFR